MTERKPHGVTYEDWVDRQIRRAQERGAFDGLPGAGKPLRDLDRGKTGEEWVVDWARREEADLRAALPPSLAFRREKQDLLEDLARVPAERRLREAVEDFNARLRRALLRPQEGPPLTTMPLDVEALVERWRAERPPPPPPAPPTRARAEERRRRRWWWRRP
ncbi:DUF1992 domain-containing protein [Vallicoccus soli]|uniref:DUF1992 domain-containing protein n=1 Tax=Vallicoccus soli TaxID=2339232 RepID=A0A3A3YT08_9ACTN|nr:DUF1992 domain-containing protein [Vallicoccus soli]RJK93830.1 DUF1992 domain-containing protein [Vallicoccus soli]